MERSHTIMAKWIKKLLGLAAIGSAAAGLVYYFKKSKKDEGEDFNDDFEDEDFDLDNDLQPVDREYVDLNAGTEFRRQLYKRAVNNVNYFLILHCLLLFYLLQHLFKIPTASLISSSFIFAYPRRIVARSSVSFLIL